MGVLHDGPRRRPGCFCGNCDLQREHRPGARARFTAGLADATHSARGRRRCRRPHRYRRAYRRPLADEIARSAGRGREPGRGRRHHRRRGGREVAQGRLHRVHDEQLARDLARDVQGVALRSAQRLRNGVDGRNRGPGAGDGARLSGEGCGRRARGGAGQSRQIQFRQRRRRDSNSPARSPSGKACGRRLASRRSSSCQVF